MVTSWTRPREDLGRLSVEDIEDGLTRVSQELNRPLAAADTARLIHGFAKTSTGEPAVGGDPFNARVQEEVRKFLGGLTQ